MKTNFKSITQQATYINKFIERKTDLNKNCMFCGKPASIQHNRKNPYEVRILCRPCRTKYGLHGHTVDDKPSDLPTINLLEHINTNFKMYRDRTLTEEQMKIIDECIELNLYKAEFCKRLNVYPKALEWMLSEYEHIKPGITEKYLQAINIGRRNILLKNALNRKRSSKSNTKLIQIKEEQRLSTKDIVEKTNHKISTASLNLIIEGKLEPSDKFKKLIAKALNVKVEDIF